MKKLLFFLVALMMSASMMAQTTEELNAMLSELNADSMRATVSELQQYQRCAFFGNRDAAQYLVG